MSRVVRASAALMLTSLIAGCSGSADWQEIGRSDLGPSWPLTVQSGEIMCTSDRQVLFRSNGTVYGVNALALTRGYAQLDPIWAVDPLERSGPDLWPLLRAGLMHCARAGQRSTQRRRTALGCPAGRHSTCAWRYGGHPAAIIKASRATPRAVAHPRSARRRAP
jgi:hypothetical protein